MFKKPFAKLEATMYKAIIQLSRADGYSFDEFIDYWETEHAPLAAELPNLQRYAICPVADPEKAPHDGVAELVFETQEALFAALDSETFGKVQQDAAEFTETDETVFFVVEERVQVDRS